MASIRAMLARHVERTSSRYVSRRALFTSSECAPRLLLETPLRTPPSTHARAFAIRARARHVALAASPSARQSEVPRTRSVLVRSPTVEDLGAQELDAELLSNSEINVLVTDRAAEQLRRISTREGKPDVALRIAVESGGCHGYQYKMGLSDACAPEDYHLTHPDIRPSNLYIDAVSLPMLNGSTVDYATELIGSSFRVSGNPQAKGGCGCGVSWELND